MMELSVQLKKTSGLDILVDSIRLCYESNDRSDSAWEGDNYILGPKDKALIEQVIKNGHTSTLEHLTYTFRIENFSRAVLQELSRHRIASPSVKSTRYTLKELISELPFFGSDGMHTEYAFERAANYVKLTGKPAIDIATIRALDASRSLLVEGYPIDEVKYSLPEGYLTKENLTINARSLRNLLSLRLSKRAHFEIQEMARKIYDAIPASHQFIYSDIL
jgi:thymidylate synthase (FAD)